MADGWDRQALTDGVFDHDTDEAADRRLGVVAHRLIDRGGDGSLVESRDGGIASVMRCAIGGYGASSGAANVGEIRPRAALRWRPTCPVMRSASSAHRWERSGSGKDS
jgi:hypothetical protein